MSDLPTGWTDIELKNLGEYINGRAFKPSEWKRSGLPIIRIQNLTNTSSNYNYSDKRHEEKYLVKNGDLLVAWSASLGAYIWKGEDAWLNQHIFKVIINDLLVKKEFLYYTIVNTIDELYKKTHGTGMVHVTKPVFESHIVNLPPLNEQKRIAEKLDKLLARVEESKARLEKIPVIIKRFRQSVLNAAVTGELTKDWRERNESSSEKLYAEIIEHQEKRKRNRKTRDQSVSVDEIKIPNEWVWCRNELLSTDEQNSICAGPFGTIFKAKDFRLEGVPIIFLRHVGDGKYLTKKPGYMDKTVWENLFQSYSVFGGELLVTKLGDPPGTCAIYPEEIGPAMVTPDVIKMNVKSKFMVKEFLMYYFNSPASRTIAFGIAYGVTRLRMNLPLFRSLPIPLPTIQEQKEIVKRVKALLKTADEIEARYKKAKGYIDKLTQSILAKAFRGELVPQDPNDEPAEKLLERIKEERENQKDKSKKKKVIKDLMKKHNKTLKKLS